MDGGATPCPSPLLWPRAPLTQCRKVQAVKGERPLAVPVGAAHLSGGPGPQGSRESSASNGCGVEPGEGGRVSAPQGRSGGGGEERGVVWCAGQRGQRTGCLVRVHVSLSLSLSVSLSCRVSADVVTRVPLALGRYCFCITSCGATSGATVCITVTYYHFHCVTPHPT